MKKHNVKGFTLIELIVVLAIFGLILASAMSLLTPINAKLTQATLHEGGNAAVSNINSYIKGQLSPCENLYVINTAPIDASGNLDTATVQSAVSTFINDHYTGILRSGSSAASPSYATGDIHVLIISNDTINGHRGTVWDCDCLGCSFAPGATPSAPSAPTMAVNEAYYDNFDFIMKFGDYEFNQAQIVDAFNNPATVFTTESFDTMSTGLNANNTTLTIFATNQNKTSNVNSSVYTFSEHCTMSLVNIANAVNVRPLGRYFTTGQVQATDPGDGSLLFHDDGTGTMVPTMTAGIVDYYSANADINRSTASAVTINSSGSGNGYMLIYAFNSEIVTG